MIAIIRIHGRVKIRREAEETLKRLRLGKKFACVLIDEKDEVRIGMLKKIKPYVCYGVIDKKTEEEIKKKRGEKIKSGENAGKLKPFFRLHPPQGGFKKSTKKMQPKGILGEWKNNDIIKLLEKMI